MNCLSRFKLHPLQIERIQVEEDYRKEREKIDKMRDEKLLAIQSKCTHEWEDGRSAWDTIPYDGTYCVICHKY